MSRVGLRLPKEARKTALYDAEDWYQQFLAEKLNRPYEPVKRSNFGHYSMAVNYLTSMMEEAKAVDKLAIFNIDHMAQLKVSGKDSISLLERVLPIDIANVSIGQCKYTLLLTPQGTVLDDLILMRLSEKEFILVINAGHDITDTVIIDDKEVNYLADGDYLLSYRLEREDVSIEDISQQLVKIDAQGPYSYKLLSMLYGKEVLKNRRKPKKNMSFFTFNEFDYKGNTCYISRTGYTNRWGWEMYFPVEIAVDEFKRIMETAYDLGGLLVGLGGRDENRISAGATGLPLYGNEYDKYHTPTNAPLFNAAVNMGKDKFAGKDALAADIANKVDKRMVLFITEGLVVGRGIYKDGERLGSVTSSINSPNIPYEKRVLIGSKRKIVNEEDGRAAIGLGWLYHNPFEVDEKGEDVMIKDGDPVRIDVEFYKEDDQRNPKGKAVKGYISGDGVNPATSHKPLRLIEKL